MPEAQGIYETLRGILSDSSTNVSAAARICAASSTLLPVDGAAISVVGQNNIRGTVCASDEIMERLEDLQNTTGIGPCVDAIAQGRPVMAAELNAECETRWPGFALEANRAGAEAVFAMPLHIGAIRFGAIDLYRGTAGALSAGDLADALLVAEAATLAVVDMQDTTPVGDLDERWWDLSSFYRIEIHQATGMLMAHHDVDATEALVLLRARAFAEGIGIGELAQKVVAREVSFTSDDDSPDRGFDADEK